LLLLLHGLQLVDSTRDERRHAAVIAIFVAEGVTRLDGAKGAQQLECGVSLAIAYVEMTLAVENVLKAKVKVAVHAVVVGLSKDANLSAVEEVLTRTAVINTLCSFAEVDGVYFMVEGEPFRDADGEEPGIMEPDQFIYNSYTEMRNYERVRLHLYFANETGDKLVDAYRTVVYNSNMPLERIVIEQVIQGPNGNFAYPTVNSAAKVINVTTRDRRCYVNLNSEFLHGQEGVTAQTALYSIVNSLCELPSIESVQISVDGNTDAVFMESIPLTGSFRMNEEIVERRADTQTQ
jgi:germination protein M